MFTPPLARGPAALPHETTTMRILDLEPQFIRHGDGGRMLHVDALDRAQGIRFNDPMGRGNWSVVWFRDRDVPDEAMPGPLRANVAGGRGYHDLTLTPSIDETCGGKYPGEWHGHITNGEVTP